MERKPSRDASEIDDSESQGVQDAVAFLLVSVFRMTRIAVRADDQALELGCAGLLVRPVIDDHVVTAYLALFRDEVLWFGVVGLIRHPLIMRCASHNSIISELVIPEQLPRTGARTNRMTCLDECGRGRYSNHIGKGIKPTT
jgi:hypothetical protein